MQITSELINNTFKSLGYKARDNQESIVSRVLTEYLVNNKKNVVLCLDTGAGKSVIAAVISECLRKLTQPALPTFILMHQNTLTKQYHDSFKDNGEDKFALIKGAVNYKCNYLRKKLSNNFTMADECQKEHMSAADVSRNCHSCEYAESRKLLNTTHNLITNYSYFFISKLWADHLDNRDFHIFDEAHLINDIFSEHSAIYVSDKRLTEYIGELEDEGLAIFLPEVNILRDLRAQIINNKVTEDNFCEFLTILNGSYSRIESEFSTMAEESDNLAGKVKYSKKHKKYKNLNCKIGDYFHYGYECVFDSTPNIEFSVKPIFIGDMIEAFSSKFNLFMSATITQEYAETTFKLKDSETAFVTDNPTFDPENRPIYFLGKSVLNYNSMKDKETLKEIVLLARKITELHDKDKGIILTPSFKVNEMLGNLINNVKVFEHTRGIDTSKLIKEFENCKEPCVLISPSLYEGLDLDGDSSRYQIIVKTPYPSLGDKRTAYIADKYPEVYKMNTLYKILQGIGRSVRSADDWACSYFIDKNSFYLYNTNYNIWKNRYSVKI